MFCVRRARHCAEAGPCRHQQMADVQHLHTVPGLISLVTVTWVCPMWWWLVLHGSARRNVEDRHYTLESGWMISDDSSSMNNQNTIIRRHNNNCICENLTDGEINVGNGMMCVELLCLHLSQIRDMRITTIHQYNTGNRMEYWKWLQYADCEQRSTSQEQTNSVTPTVVCTRHKPNLTRAKSSCYANQTSCVCANRMRVCISQSFYRNLVIEPNCTVVFSLSLLSLW